MPIDEYRCRECGVELEVLQKITDALLVDCPACGKASLRKKVSASAFRLKGGGWYETDFKTGNKKNLARGDTDAGTGDKSDKSVVGDKSGGSEKSGGDSGAGAGGDGGGKATGKDSKPAA